MKFRTVRLGLARSLVALSVSIAIVLSTHSFAFSSFAESATSANAPAPSTDASESEFKLVAASATTTSAGILIQWHTNSAADNLGFNVYRLKAGQRTRVNREIIPGAVFASADARPLMRAGYSYSWVDRSGTADSTYYIESVSSAGTTKTHEAISPSSSVSEFDRTPETLSPESANAAESTDSFERHYPAAESGINWTTGAIEDQWAVAAQTALRIGVKKDGWYRVTQPQMIAAGFDPGANIRNLHLFVNAQEIAINTSQLTGALGANDYIEFYGHGLDTPNTDTQIYYLIAGTTPGKRMVGQLQLDGPPTDPPAPPDPPAPAATPTPAPPASGDSPPATSPDPVLRDPIFQSAVDPNGWFFIGFVGPQRQEPTQSNFTCCLNTASDVPRLDNSTIQPYQPDITPPRDSEPTFSREQVAGAGGRSGEQNVSSAGILPQPSIASNSKDTTVKTSDSAIAPKSKKAVGRSRRRGKLRKRAHSRRRAITPTQKLKVERNHPMLAPASAPASFDYTVERKDRTIYFSSLLNGEPENFFGMVVSAPTKSQTIASPNADLTAAGPAKLEVALQGANFVFHDVSLKFNGVLLGSILPSGGSFFGRDHVVVTFDVPVSLLRTVNTLTFVAPSGDTSIVDYTRLTYPHQFQHDKAIGNIHLEAQPFDGETLTVGSKTYTFRVSPATNLEIGIGSDIAATAVNIANRINLDTAATLCTAASFPADVNLTANTVGPAGSTISLTVDGFHLTKTAIADSGGLKFSLRGTQSVSADGFGSSSMRLIDYTDPLDIKISRPAAQPSASGFAISVPTTDPPSKPTRLLYAFPDGQFDQPASISMNQPSTLNLNSNATSFLIISHKDFVASAEPLRVARVNQGMSARVVDVEDIYDEFSFGAHGPQAIKDFLAHAAAHWTTSPSYIVFIGDASLDPRTYFGGANVDLVPTKTIDDSFTETVSDDWLADVNGDDIADVPIGRIPVRTAAEANLVVSKIVNYSPASVPQTALLIADDPVGGFDFEEGNDNVQAILAQQVPSMTVQRVNVRTVGGVQAKIDINDGINQGRAIVNYSGHGNVNVWSGQSIWLTGNATALTNGMNKLTFVIVMDCLNGYYQDPNLLSMSEGFLKAPSGGAVAAFASSGLTTTFGQRQMELELYRQLYGVQPISVGAAIKIAKAASSDPDVRRTWIYFGDPSIKIR